MISIGEATTGSEFDSVRALARAYIRWLKQLYPDGQDLVDQYFELLEAELASLPGDYGPPTGKLLLAYYEGEAAGTVAVHDIGDHVCEMKRMFVYPQFHGKGIGRALAITLMDESRKLGYSRMKLETSRGQEAALGLYGRLGFREIPAYYDIPDNLRANMLFLELDL